MFVATMPMVIAMTSCIVMGMVVEHIGARWTFYMAYIVLALTWITMALSISFWALILARVFQGTFVAVFHVITSVYPAEVSAVQRRGIMMGIIEVMFLLGAFLTYVGGLFMQPSTLAYVFSATVIIQLICISFLRESPLWFARRNKMAEAAEVLVWLRDGSCEEVDKELEHIKISVDIKNQKGNNALKQLLFLRRCVYLKPVLLCVLLLLFKELTGQYAATIYTVNMFRLAGSTLDPYICAVVVGAARLLPCLLSCFLIDRFNRRFLLSTCMFIASLSFATLGGILWYWDGVETGLPHSIGWIPLVCLCVFTLAQGCGLAPTTWTVTGELIPPPVRNVGAGLLLTCFCLFQFLVGFTFPYMTESLGTDKVFLVYSVCSLAGVIYVLFFLPETRGKTFVEIQKTLNPKHEIFTTITAKQDESNGV